VTLEERFDALLGRLDEHFAAVNKRLDSIEKQRGQDNAGLRLELNQIHGRLGEHFATLRNVADNTSELLAEQNRMRENVSSQIHLEIQKRLDETLPFMTLAAANGAPERQR
jgi:regulator of replication initiation timing